MTATSMQGDKPPSKVRHSWRCSRQAPVVETMKPHPTTGQMIVVSQCQGCGCDDMDSRLLDKLIME